MPCPRCSSLNINYAGSFAIKRSGVRRKRLRCKDCGRMFIIRDVNFRKKISFKIRDQVLRLYRTKKPHKTKFDGMKKNTYSTREIAQMLNVSKSFVGVIVKNGKPRPESNN